MPVITNISCYKFAPLGDLKELRERLIERCKSLGLKGTILLSTEGINMFVAGPREDVDRLVDELRSVPGLDDLKPKYSDSQTQPFNRMLVRIKKEIIAFGVEGIDPARYTSPRVDARTLKQWLDEGRPVRLLDTRNDYEVKLGTFKNAITFPLDHFRHFPDAVRTLPDELKDEIVVSFCTGGIRCEKAAPFLEREGFKHVYQLDGGILKYFEEAGGAHYEGECFVFDQRTGLDPSLHETGSAQCFVCQSPLTEGEQKDARFEQGVSCPYCFKTTSEQMRESIAHREAALRAFTSPAPGSAPYENRRPLHVPEKCDGLALLDCLCTLLPHVPREEWLMRAEQGRLRNLQDRHLPWNHIVHAGDRIEHVLPEAAEPELNFDVRVLHEDEALIVLHKPAPLPMHPCGRFNRNTLQYVLDHVYAPQHPRPAHRLDAATTGLVLFARTRHFAKLLARQFAESGVEKVYLARVKGSPSWEQCLCDRAIAYEPGDAGIRDVADDGLDARTEFRVLQRHADGTTLLEARPVTGRTNQIRLHLRELGHPIVGDEVYDGDRAPGAAQTPALDAAPLCLHAWKLTLMHPLSKTRVEFEDVPPAWA